MTLHEILSGGGAGIVLLLSLLEIAPIKLNPWSGLAKMLGRAINGEVLSTMKTIQAAQKAQADALAAHIKADDERNADGLRERILRFNTELLRGGKHTREDFIEILSVIDGYEAYCAGHPEYRNNRATLAIQNIKRVYVERLQKRDFLGETPVEVHT